MSFVEFYMNSWRLECAFYCGKRIHRIKIQQRLFSIERDCMGLHVVKTLEDFIRRCEVCKDMV